MSNSKRTKAKFIDDVQVTNDCLTSRAGLNLFARSLRDIGLFPHINRLFGWRILKILLLNLATAHND